MQKLPCQILILPMVCSQELCGLAKHLQATGRSDLLNKLANLGLFKVLPLKMASSSTSCRFAL